VAVRHADDRLVEVAVPEADGATPWVMSRERRFAADVGSAMVAVSSSEAAVYDRPVLRSNTIEVGL
jgi:hypothetical protein